jgi:hypothetical protein
MAQTRLETRLTARDETSRAFRTLQSNLNSVDAAFTRVAAVAAGLATVFEGVFVRDLISVNKEFQSLKASLITFTGSVKNADGAFRILRDFTQKTPFSLREVVSSFNILVAQGIRPTEAQLISFADIAGGTSKSIEQFAEAVADATVNEFERLKEFGIRASKEGNELTLSIGNFTKKINNDSDSILAALSEIGQLQFAGGAARQAETLGGSITNLRDSFDGLLFAIGEAGFAGELSKAIQALTKMISGNDDLASSISNKLTTALYAAVAAIRFVVDNLDTLLIALKVAFSALIIQKVAKVAMAILEFGRNVVRSQVALSLFTTLMKITKGNLLLIAGGAAAAATAYAEFQEEINGAITEMIDGLEVGALMESVLSSLGLSTNALSNNFNDLISELDGTDEQFIQNRGSILDFIPVIGDADSSISATTASASDLKTAMGNIRKAVDPVSVALEELTLENTLLKRAVANGSMTQEQAISVMNRLTREALGLDTTMAGLGDRQKIVDAAFATGVISAAEYENAIRNIKSEVIDFRAETERTYGAGAIKGIADYYNSISDNAKNATDFVAGAFASLEQSMSDFFFTGKLDFGGFVDAIKRGLADLAAKALITVGMNFLGKVFPNLAFADGGMVPGSGGPRADNILARVSSGEYVIKASSVSKFGSGFFDALNAGQMPNMGGGGGGGGGFSVDAGLMDSITPGFLLGGLFKGIGKIIGGIVDAITNIIKGVMDAIRSVVGAIANAVKGLVESIISGDLLAIAAFALPFILPGVGAAMFANLAAGQGFVASVAGGISSSFAGGILGGGSLTSIATSVGIEFAKGAVIDKMSSSISENILGVTGGMAASGSAFEQDRAARFGRLYNEAAPYLAAGTGANVQRGDNVRVGESGPELFIPNRNGTIAPIKGTASELIDSVNSMKNEIITLRRELSRALSQGKLAGARS